MMTISKILVALDFSEHSRRALEYAVDLALRYGATLELVHVLDAAVYALPEPRLVEPEQYANISKELQGLLDKAQADAAARGVPHVDTALLQGKPDVEIVRRARDGRFDIIVVATHGRSGVKHLLIGSVAERVVRAAPCPVFAVKAIELAEAVATASQPQA